MSSVTSHIAIKRGKKREIVPGHVSSRGHHSPEILESFTVSYLSDLHGERSPVAVHLSTDAVVNIVRCR